MKKIILISFFVFSILHAKTQILPNEPSSNFYDFISKYYTLNPSMLNDTTHKSGIQKEYDRLAKIWVPRLYPHGDCSIAANAIYNYANNFNNTAKTLNQYSNIHWKYKGPIWQINPSTQAGNLMGTGQIHRITLAELGFTQTRKVITFCRCVITQRRKVTTFCHCVNHLWRKVNIF
ncbi:MAG: hypothetical protein WCH34_04370 [Bacteroidota bacterium]